MAKSLPKKEEAMNKQEIGCQGAKKQWGRRHKFYQKMNQSSKTYMPWLTACYK